MLQSGASPATSASGDGARTTIDRDDVIDAALALVEAGGGDALTMRKLAAELGVAPTSIYWHVGGRDEVVLALIERVSEQQAAVDIAGSTPRERVLDAALTVWRSALAHPEVTALAHRVGATSLLELPLEQALARELTAAGLTGDEARDALRAILWCVGGFLVVALRPADAIPPERQSTHLWASVDDPGIDPSTVHALARPADHDALAERTLAAVVDHYVP